MIKPECINLYDENGKETSFQDRIYRTDKISAAITVSFRPFYLEEKNGGNKSSRRTNRVYDKSGLSPTLNTMQGGNRQPMVIDEVVMNERECKSDDDEQKTRYRIRKLTCREVWRLMGFSDEDFEKAQAVNSNSQLYKQAGNSIIRQVLIAIFLQLNIQDIKNWNDRTEQELQGFENAETR